MRSGSEVGGYSNEIGCCRVAEIMAMKEAARSGAPTLSAHESKKRDQ
jgi:hypothetical protein